MTDTADVQGTWVEIGERSAGDELVFYRQGSDIPPARGRRQLLLQAEGRAEGTDYGPGDAGAAGGAGGWRLDGEVLHVEVPGWEGDYEIKSAAENELILRRR